MGACASHINNPASFWILGLLNNFIFVVMNAGANNINEAGIGFVYLANVVPSLMAKATGPYWFDHVSYGLRIWACAAMMVICLLTVAWGQEAQVKLVGVCFASLSCGIGEASILGMAAFYDSKVCLTAWSSGTGFAGIAGYMWSILFDAIDSPFQVQVMAGMWIPIVWLLTFHCLLERPWIDGARDTARLRDAEPCDQEDGERDAGVARDKDMQDDGYNIVIGRGNADAQPSCRLSHLAAEDRAAVAAPSASERFRFVLGLWPYMVPLILVYAAEYTIQAGFWAAMGFPVTDSRSRHSWYKWSNFVYQVGVFISRSSFVLVCKNRGILWLGAWLQVLMVFFFWAAAAAPFGGWWLLAPALFVGLMGGGVYVGAFCLISQEIDPRYKELALTSASLGDSLGIILADILGIIVQGCMFGRMGVTDTKPDFTCGYGIWDAHNASAGVRQ